MVRRVAQDLPDVRVIHRPGHDVIAAPTPVQPDSPLEDLRAHVPLEADEAACRAEDLREPAAKHSHLRKDLTQPRNLERGEAANLCSRASTSLLTLPA